MTDFLLTNIRTSCSLKWNVNMTIKARSNRFDIGVSYQLCFICYFLLIYETHLTAVIHV